MEGRTSSLGVDKRRESGSESGRVVRSGRRSVRVVFPTGGCFQETYHHY